jgi:hypothetical protein
MIKEIISKDAENIIIESPDKGKKKTDSTPKKKKPAKEEKKVEE